MSVPKEVVEARKGMTAAISRKLGGEFFSHTVTFARTPVRWDESPEEGLEYVVGSGTLVQLDIGHREPLYGVLTCGHVLGAFEKSKEGTHSDKMTLLLPPSGPGHKGQAYGATIPYQPRTAFTVGANNRSSVGPDLAWLPLAHQHAQSLQRNARTRAVFYNLATRLQIHDAYERYLRTVKPGDANEHLSREVHMIVGWNREIQARNGGRRGGIWMNEVVPETMSAAEGWTYRDYRINDDRWEIQSYGDGTKLPTTWGGLSGGAIWIVWRSDPAVDRYEKILAGVVFYESPQWGQRTRIVRTHYDLSLIRLLHRAGIAPQFVMNEEDIAKAIRNLPLPERWEE